MSCSCCVRVFPCDCVRFTIASIEAFIDDIWWILFPFSSSSSSFSFWNLSSDYILFDTTFSRISRCALRLHQICLLLLSSIHQYKYHNSHVFEIVALKFNPHTNECYSRTIQWHSFVVMRMRGNIWMLVCNFSDVKRFDLIFVETFRTDFLSLIDFRTTEENERNGNKSP